MPRLLWFITTVAVALSGCTSMRPVPVVTTPAPQSAAARPVGHGDDVRVTLRDGRVVRFTVQAVEPGRLISADGMAYNVTDIVSLERRGFSGVKTVLLLASLPVGVFLFIAAVFAFSGK
jgi:hypothetical protein